MPLRHHGSLAIMLAVLMVGWLGQAAMAQVLQPGTVTRVVNASSCALPGDMAVCVGPDAEPDTFCRLPNANCSVAQDVVTALRIVSMGNSCHLYTWTWRCAPTYRMPCGQAWCDPRSTCVAPETCACPGNMSGDAVLADCHCGPGLVNTGSACVLPGTAAGCAAWRTTAIACAASAATLLCGVAVYCARRRRHRVYTIDAAADVARAESALGAESASGAESALGAESASNVRVTVHANRAYTGIAPGLDQPRDEMRVPTPPPGQRSGSEAYNRLGSRTNHIYQHLQRPSPKPDTE